MRQCGMTIRKTLLITFLLFSAVFAALMTALAYSRARAALSDEIRRNLETQALSVMQQVDAMLFERVKDMESWRRLEIMQELKVGDVDKRLARFLDDIKSAYAGIYTSIYCVHDAQVIAASEATRIGARADLAAAWLSIRTKDGLIAINRPDAFSAAPIMTLSGPIIDAYGGAPLATLAADISWMEITALLDHATTHNGREALLLDAQGRPLAVSRGLRAVLPHDGAPLAQWQQAATGKGVFSSNVDGLQMGHLLVGYAHSRSYKGLPDLGWNLVILTPERVAFAAIEHLLWSLLAMLAASLAVAAGLAIRVSASTARPIQSLTAYARAIGRDIDTPARHIVGSSEVRELSRAFNRTLDELRASRAHVVRASKLAAAGEMAAKLAHEVRTPLGIIRSSAQLINRQDRLDARGHEMMSYMITEVDRINELVTSLLDSARARPPEFRPHRLADIVRQVLDMLHDRFEGHSVSLESSDRKSVV